MAIMAATASHGGQATANGEERPGTVIVGRGLAVAWPCMAVADRGWP